MQLDESPALQAGAPQGEQAHLLVAGCACSFVHQGGLAMGGIPPIPPGGERAHGWEIFGVGKPSGLSMPKIDPRLFRDSMNI